MDVPAARQKILMADDEQFITIAYRSGLEQAGFDVIVADNGRQALDILAANRPDLLLLDIIMPEVDGFEVLRTLQADPTYSTLPVVVLTNLSQESDEAEARRLGARDFITKSEVSINELVARIKAILRPTD